MRGISGQLLSLQCFCHLDSTDDTSFGHSAEGPSETPFWGHRCMYRVLWDWPPCLLQFSLLKAGTKTVVMCVSDAAFFAYETK